METSNVQLQQLKNNYSTELSELKKVIEDLKLENKKIREDNDKNAQLDVSNQITDVHRTLCDIKSTVVLIKSVYNRMELQLDEQLDKLKLIQFVHVAPEPVTEPEAPEQEPAHFRGSNEMTLESIKNMLQSK